MRRCITLPRSSRVPVSSRRLIRCLHQERPDSPYTSHDPPPPPRRRLAPKSPIRQQLNKWQIENGPGVNQDQFNFPNDEERTDELATVTLDHDLAHGSLEFKASPETEDTDAITILNQGDLVEIMFVFHLNDVMTAILTLS